MTKLVPDFLSLLANVRTAHWAADSTTNAHRTLGDLYEALDPLTDTLVENLLAKQGSRELPAADLRILPGLTLTDLLAGGFDLVARQRAALSVDGMDDDALNTLADMRAALNKAKYLLML